MGAHSLGGSTGVGVEALPTVVGVSEEGVKGAVGL